MHHWESRFWKLCLICAFIFTGVLSAQAVELDYYLPMDVSYDPSIPTPEEYFGYQVGTWHLRHDQLIGYLRAVDEASDRITLETYGYTHEQRPLVLLTVTSPDNHQHLEQIKRQHQLLSDPQQSGTLNAAAMPVIVWLGYSIHGNEPSGSNSVPLLTYYLAAAQNRGLERKLEGMVILIDPCFNPDGLARFAHWANMHRGNILVGDPNHREHTEPWPGGRTNHYWFDLNRDWLLLQHPESRGRVAKFQQWLPNVLTDHHEMGTDNTYFMQPGVPSRNNPLTPETTFDLTAEIARRNAQALDSLGSLYFTRERFDDFYYGKGSTYPDINGSIGILFEQASSRGHLQESEHGTLTFSFTIRNHLTTSLSTIDAAFQHRSDLLNHQREFYSSSLREARQFPVKAYVFAAPADPPRVYHMVQLLRRHHIRTYRLGSTITINGKQFADASYIVPLAQPKFRLIRALFEQRTTFTDSVFYDVSAWTIPLAFNVSFEAYTGRQVPEALVGEEITNPQFPEGAFLQEDDAYAYGFQWHNYYAPRAAYRLLKAGIRLKTATKPFTSEMQGRAHTFDYGSVIIPMQMQQGKQDTIRSILRQSAAEDGVSIYSISSGLTESGIDLGSPSFQSLTLPKVLVMAGDGVSSYEAGEVWHLLDHRFRMPVSLVEVARIGRIDLHRYNVIIMVSGDYDRLSDQDVEQLKRWVRTGGTMIALSGGVRWAMRHNFTNAKQVQSARDTTEWRRRPYVKASQDRATDYIGGAIFQTTLDLTHPLAFGYTGELLPVFRQGTQFIQHSESPYATPVLYSGQPLLSGYISEQNEQQLANSASVVIGSMGAGKVILCVDELNFRSYWYGTNKLLLNGIFFGSIIESGTTRVY